MTPNKLIPLMKKKEHLLVHNNGIDYADDFNISHDKIFVLQIRRLGWQVQ